MEIPFSPLPRDFPGHPMPSSVPDALRLELSRAKIVPGEEATADEWMTTLDARRDEAAAGLAAERIAVEASFLHREADDSLWLYHLTIGSREVPERPSVPDAIDELHLAYNERAKMRGWEELTPRLLLVPDTLRDAMVEAVRPPSDAGAPPRVLVLNGGSSSGKTTLARALQETLPGAWLRFGIDDLVDAVPPHLLGGDGIDLGAQVTVGPAFTAAESQWMAGVAAMARAGAHVVVDDCFVSGPAAQERWRRALTGIPTRWVGVRCPAGVATQREAHRGDRATGMAAAQADSVHRDIHYDIEVDTSVAAPEQTARVLRDAFWPS